MPRRRSSSPLLNLPLLIITLPIIAFLLLFFVVPSLLTSTSHKSRPASVRNGWDSVNILLVLFAIMCGIFARRNDEESPPSEDDHNSIATTHSYNVSRVVQSKAELQPQQSSWFDDLSSSDQKIFDNGQMFGTPGTRTGRLKRNSSSYPDLRQEPSFWETGEERFRFFDDFGIDKYRSLQASLDYDGDHRRQRSISEEWNVKEIQVDTFTVRSSTPSSSSPPPPPPPPPPLQTTSKVRQQRTYEAVSRGNYKVSQNDVDGESASSKRPPPTPPSPPKTTNHHQKRTNEVSHGETRAVQKDYDHGFTNISTPPPTPPPPPPPPRRTPPTPPVAKAKVSDKSGRRKRSAAKEIKMVFASVLNSQRKKRRKQKTKSASYEDELHFPPEPTSFTIPPPPPPPPPPPSAFHNLFRKVSKTKRIHSFYGPTPPPPPPPLPPSMHKTHRSSKHKNQLPAPSPPPAPPPEPSRKHNSFNTRRPPLPTRVNNSSEESGNNEDQSPLIPMPPPPPFRVRGFQFVMRGDYVKIRSSHSSRCSSPDLDEVDKESNDRVNLMDGKDENPLVGSVSCPSPDVNIKADTFIARLKDGWRLEKINSMREKVDMGHDPNRG